MEKSLMSGLSTAELNEPYYTLCLSVLTRESVDIPGLRRISSTNRNTTPVRDLALIA
jgi:hypothetical protein